jgi:CHASE3 domain sensor protein
MLQMDNQFNKLKQAYSDNYIQFKVTGDSKYQSAYESAKQGLDSIISQVSDAVKTDKKGISDFYKSGVESKLQQSEQSNRMLKQGILEEKDEITAARLRQNNLPTTSSSITTTQWISLGALLVASLVLSM